MTDSPLPRSKVWSLDALGVQYFKVPTVPFPEDIAIPKWKHISFAYMMGIDGSYPRHQLNTCPVGFPRPRSTLQRQQVP